MVEEGSVLSRVSVRSATLADYEAVMKIHGNVFDGFDYLRNTYHDFVRNPNAYNFVAELDGEVVAYKGYIMDGPNEAVAFGSRVTIKLQRERVFDKLHHVSLQRMRSMQPDLKLVTWVALDSDLYWNKPKLEKLNITLIERWHALFYDCTANDVAALLSNHRSMSPTCSLLHPTIEQAEQLLSDPKNYTRLFRTGYFVAHYNWLPRRTTMKNIYDLVRVHRVLFSMNSPTKIGAVSFCAPHTIGNGATLIAMHYYHVEQNTDTLLSHMIEHLHHGLKVLQPGVQMGISIRGQLDVDITKVKEFFNGRLGVKRSTGEFKYETGIMGGQWLESSKI